MSKLLGDLKRKEKGFNIKWSILRWLLLYSASQSKCNLCIEEKLWLIKSDSKNNQTKDLDLKYSRNAVIKKASNAAIKVHTQTILMTGARKVTKQI